MFPNGGFAKELEHYVEARLHNDGYDGDELTETSRKIVALQTELVGKVGAPYYLVMDPSDRKVLGLHTLSVLKQEERLLAFLVEKRKAWQRKHGKAGKKPG